MFVSENLIQNLLMFSGRMEFNIFGVLELDVSKCVFDIMLLGGI
jgi:hypothetical protein